MCVRCVFFKKKKRKEGNCEDYVLGECEKEKFLLGLHDNGVSGGFCLGLGNDFVQSFLLGLEPVPGIHSLDL